MGAAENLKGRSRRGKEPEGSSDSVQRVLLLKDKGRAADDSDRLHVDEAFDTHCTKQIEGAQDDNVNILNFQLFFVFFILAAIK